MTTLDIPKEGIAAYDHAQSYGEIVRKVMPELDALRGLAIAMVVSYHLVSWSEGPDHFHGISKLFVVMTGGGWLGVNLFFVLSGFLITGLLIDSQDSTAYFRRFYIRRGLRIFPAYLFLIGILWCLGYSKHFLVLSFIYLSNITSLFGVANAYGPLWSLAVEEHFYLIWPALIKKLSLYQVAFTSSLIIFASPLARAYGFRRGHDIHMWTWYVADGLAIGAVCACFVRMALASRKNVKVAAYCSTGVGVIIMAMGLPLGIMTRGVQFGAAMQVVPWHFLFAGVLLFALLLGSSSLKSIVRVRVLGYLGRISYGLYLVHVLFQESYDSAIHKLWPAMAIGNGSMPLLLLRMAVVSVLSIGFAALSRATLEEWFLGLKPRFEANMDKPRQGTPTVHGVT